MIIYFNRNHLFSFAIITILCYNSLIGDARHRRDKLNPIASGVKNLLKLFKNNKRQQYFCAFGSCPGFRLGTLLTDALPINSRNSDKV